jgi:hypothetical protein
MFWGKQTNLLRLTAKEITNKVFILSRAWTATLLRRERTTYTERRSTLHLHAISFRADRRSGKVQNNIIKDGSEKRTEDTN